MTNIVNLQVNLVSHRENEIPTSQAWRQRKTWPQYKCTVQQSLYVVGTKVDRELEIASSSCFRLKLKWMHSLNDPTKNAPADVFQCSVMRCSARIKAHLIQ